MGETTQVRTFCPLCVSKCGATATVTDGEFVALGPDPEHPTGTAVCVKGKAAPEIVRHPDRLRHPLRRTNPKGADDPGWRSFLRSRPALAWAKNLWNGDATRRSAASSRPAGSPSNGSGPSRAVSVSP